MGSDTTPELPPEIREAIRAALGAESYAFEDSSDRRHRENMFTPLVVDALAPLLAERDLIALDQVRAANDNAMYLGEQLARATSMVRRMLNDWPYQPPEVVEPERLAIRRWLQDEGPALTPWNRGPVTPEVVWAAMAALHPDTAARGKLRQLPASYYDRAEAAACAVVDALAAATSSPDREPEQAADQPPARIDDEALADFRWRLIRAGIDVPHDRFRLRAELESWLHGLAVRGAPPQQGAGDARPDFRVIDPRDVPGGHYGEHWTVAEAIDAARDLAERHGRFFGVQRKDATGAWIAEPVPPLPRDDEETPAQRVSRAAGRAVERIDAGHYDEEASDDA